MNQHEQELRDALAARSVEVTPEFRSRVRAALAQQSRPGDGIPRLAFAVVVALVIAAVGGLLVTQQLVHTAPAGHHVVPRAAASPSPVAPSPTPASQQIPYPTGIQVSAVNGVIWANLDPQYGLYRSTDGGSTWQQRPAAPDGGDVSFVNADVGWALGGGSPATQCQAQFITAIDYTSDGGTTWRRIQPTGIGSSQCKADISFIDAEHGFITAGDPNSPPIIYRSADGGYTWKASAPFADPPGFHSGMAGFELSAGTVRQAGTALLVNVAGHATDGTDHAYVFHSTDGGATWTYLATVPQGHAAFVTAAHWFANGMALETTNAGATWHGSSSTYGQAAPVEADVVFVSPTTGYAIVTTRGEIQITTDGGVHWTAVKSPGT